jgi:hypothetical protein
MADMTRSEQLLNSIATGEPSGCAAMTRRERFLAYLAGECDAPPSKAYTREEKLLAKICANGPGGGGGGGETTEPGKPYIDTSKIMDFERFGLKNRLNNYLGNLDTSNGTSFNNMFSRSDMLVRIPPLDTSKGADFGSMFMFCGRLEEIPQLDTSKGTNFNGMFYSCVSLKTVPLLDISNATSLNTVFFDCKSLETVSLTKAKSNLMTDTFENCTALKNITIGEGWAVNIYLNYSPLTVESLHGMIENLADLTGQTAKVFKIGANNLAKIDEAHIAMLNAKNWEYS